MHDVSLNRGKKGTLRMRIHAIQTGTVAITQNWRRGKGHGGVRRLNTLLDRSQV